MVTKVGYTGYRTEVIYSGSDKRPWLRSYSGHTDSRTGSSFPNPCCEHVVVSLGKIAYPKGIAIGLCMVTTLDEPMASKMVLPLVYECVEVL